MNIMRKFTYILILTLTCSLSYAQQGFHKLGVGAELGLPLGDFGEAYSIGFGATAKGFYGITAQGDITGTLGYLHFGIKESNEYMSGSMGMIPIMIGYRHDFGGFYGEPQLGLAILKSTVKMDFGGFGDLFDDLNSSGSSSTTKATFGLGGGYVFGQWDIGARFQITDNMNFLRLAYRLPLCPLTHKKTFKSFDYPANKSWRSLQYTHEITHS